MSTTEGAGMSTELEDLFCDPCKNDGKNLAVVGYCVDCDEYLCEDCYKVHCRPSIMRHHVLQGKDNMPKKRNSKPHTCSFHAEKPLEYYCETHEEILCSTCQTAEHERCENVRQIKDILPEVDMQKEFTKLQDNTKLLKKDIDATQFVVQSTLKAISVNHNKARDGMDSIRKRVNEHIDEIEGTLDKELKTMREEDESRIMSHMNTCERMLFYANAIGSNIQPKMSKNRTEDAFIAIKRAKRKINADHIDLEKIKIDRKIKRYSFKPDEQVNKLTMQPYSFGKFEINKEETKTAQFVKNLNARCKEDLNQCVIVGICLISEELAAIVDKGNKNLKIINTRNDVITTHVLLSSPPCDITIIPNNKLAVTLPEEKQIQFFSLALPKADTVTLERSINTSETCHGIHFIKNKLIVTYLNPGNIEILNLDGTIARKIDLKLTNPKISVIPDTRLIYIFKMTGSHYKPSNFLSLIEFGDEQKIVFEIRHQIGSLHGITTDKSGTAYICDGNDVYIASNDGLYRDTIKASNVKIQRLKDLTSGGPIFYPRSIAFCERTFSLYIGTEGDKIVVYTVA